MTLKEKMIRIVAVGDPGPTQQQIATALSAQNEFQLVDVLTTPERLVREIRAAEPDIILIDHMLGEQPTLDIIDDIALQFPDSALVAVLPDSDPLRAQQVMLAGARGFLVQPFTQINLLSTLRRVRELEERRLQTKAGARVEPGAEEAPMHTIAVFSPRGGAGSSTVATNLALCLLEQTGQKVLLMEGKLFFGHLGIMLNLRAQNTIADLIPHASNLDEGLIKDVIAVHASGLHVLLAPSNIQVAQGIRPDDLYNILVNVQRLYDYVVIDAGSTLSENTVTLLDSADRVLVIAKPEMAALSDVSRFIQLSRSLGYPPEKLLIVLNRSGMIGSIKQRDIEAVLRSQLFARIPNEESNAIYSLNRGIPLVLKYPRSAASRAYAQLAKSLSAVSVAAPKPKEHVVQGADQAQRDALLASSRLG